MKTNEELFEFCEQLIKELSASENSDALNAADRIRSAAAISSVGTEIVMALRKELTDLLSSNIQLKGSTCNKIRDAIFVINAELSR